MPPNSPLSTVTSQGHPPQRNVRPKLRPLRSPQGEQLFPVVGGNQSHAELWEIEDVPDVVRLVPLTPNLDTQEDEPSHVIKNSTDQESTQTAKTRFRLRLGRDNPIVIQKCRMKRRIRDYSASLLLLRGISYPNELTPRYAKLKHFSPNLKNETTTKDWKLLSQ